MDETTKNQEAVDPENHEKEEYNSELDQPIWSLIRFDGCIKSGLSYADASDLLIQNQANNVSGLCIVTDTAALRFKKED